jgi:hypothetical protein
MTTWTSTGVFARKLKKYGKRTTSLALTWRNVHGKIFILLGTPFLLTPYSAEAWDVQWLCCKQVDNIIVHMSEEEH